MSFQITNKPSNIQLGYVQSTPTDTSVTEAGASTAVETQEEETQSTQPRTGFVSFLAEQSGGLPAGQEPTPNDLPSAATPGNLAFMPAAKTVANASTAANVNQDIFAMACVEALDVSQQSPSAYTNYLNNIHDGSLRSALSSFVANNAQVSPSTLADPYGNFNQTILQQAKTAYPTSTAQAPASTTVTSTSTPAVPASQPTTAQPTADNIGSWKAIAPDQSAANMYQQWASMGTYPEVQQAASSVVADEAKMQSDQSWLNWANQGLAATANGGTAPDGQGTQQPASYWQDQQNKAAQALRGDWQTARNDEAHFWYALNQRTNNGAQDQYNKYINDPLYTTEGEMPQGFSSAALPTAQTTTPVSTPAVQSPSTPAVQTPPTLPQSGSTVTAPALTQANLPALGESTQWPANAADLLNSSTGSQSMSQDDFKKLTEDFSTLYAKNPSQYWATLSQVADPRLAGALNFVVNDKALYNASSLRVNGASESTELQQTGNYFRDAVAGNFSNWAPQNEGGASGSVATTPATIFPGTDGMSQAAVKLMQAASPANTSVNKGDFGNAAVEFTKLYQSNPQQYYAALTLIADPKMRDLVNYAVLDTLSNHKDKASDPNYFAGLFGKYGATGYAGTSKGLSSNDSSTTLNGRGPLSGSPWKKPS